MIKINPDTIIENRFLGIPFKYGGKDFKGADCVGTCILWLRSHGFDYKYDDGKGKVLEHWFESAPSRFVDAVNKYGRLIHFHDLRKFDIILFFAHASVTRFPTGMGVMVDDRHYLSNELGKMSFVRMLDKDARAICFGGLRLHKVDIMERRK